MKKGSLTVFYSMTIMVLMSLFLTMVEVVREKAMETNSVIYTKEAVESGFSEFNSYLWKNYRLLGMDFGYNGQFSDLSMFEKKISEYAIANSNPNSSGMFTANMNFTRMEPVSVRVTKYGLLSDNGGAPLISMGAKQIITDFPELLLDEWQKHVSNINGVSSEDISSKVSDMNNAKQQADAEKEAAKKEAEENGEDFEEEPPPLSEGDYDNPSSAYSQISSMINRGILAMVIPDTSKISKKAIHVDSVSKRQRYEGSIGNTTDNGVANKLLYGQYLLTYFEHYGHQLEKDGMDYEVEYILFGKNTDEQNLAAMAQRLLLIREAQNLVSMAKDSTLRNQARIVAISVIGWTLNPLLINIAQAAVMAIWAYIESILDVRTLLAGGRVAFLKDYSNWTSTVTHLLQVTDVNFKAKESSVGMNYQDYIRAMLALEGQEKLGLRSLDAIEYSVRTQKGFEHVCADQLLYIAEPEIQYRGTPMFLGMVTVGSNNINEYIFNTKYKISYLQ